MHFGFDTFRTFFDDLIWTYTNWRPKITPGEKTDDARGAVVIFIDDLDRCPKSRIVKVLETVKLFMDHKGCVFVIGAARDIIVKALAEDYSEQDAHRFMEKIVQVTFNLPKVTDEMFQPLLKNLGAAGDRPLFSVDHAGHGLQPPSAQTLHQQPEPSSRADAPKRTDHRL